ncbi:MULTISPECIES: hypothetical protein [Nocardiopsidaceae]|uniref:Uncharacterized protein n=1 Tax=Streptomonospora nanhaiensis TaxID=1323731 RepID=A0ABY6YKU4_9ACTN|nr:hypothetical protein [Streptomonospora nanhaiensis]WAE72934.1 hypothetical protein OUQ99_27825 [Streptomonospora nanhaiensis]
MAKQEKKDVKSVEMRDGVTVITHEDGTVEEITGPVDLQLGNVTGGISFG